MDEVVWYLKALVGADLFALAWRPLLIAFLLYYSNYLLLLGVLLLHRVGFLRAPADRPPAEADALLVMPTLLGELAELDGVRRALRSVMANGYPAPLVVCVAIDHAMRAPTLVAQLERWIAGLPRVPSVTVCVARSPRRGGKAMAIETAIREIERMVRCGELARFPRLFFNMDADSELSPDALSRMAARLCRRGRFSGERPMVVTSNVCVRPSVSWQGWRHFFRVRGQLAIQVAREYMTSVGIARHNTRLLPVSSISGALYCTWSELYLEAARYGGFVKTLRFRDLAAWWFGAAPPSFAASAAPVPESTTGPGDDTWIAWLAMSARWRSGRIDLELPATPLHALAGAVRSYVFRPIAYDPAAKVFTGTPTTIRGLFRQRVRWNSSRIWLLGRFGWTHFFKWSLGGAVVFDALLTLTLHSVILAGMLLWPLAERPGHWLALLVLGSMGYAAIRAGATLLALAQDGARGNWHRLLALPLGGIYHVVFNVLTTIVGLAQDLLFFGVNTGFAPEETLIRSGTGRVALAYRVRRGLRLAVRALVRGDVPVGRFWFGWRETPWTPDGYRGWNRRGRRPK